MINWLCSLKCSVYNIECTLRKTRLKTSSLVPYSYPNSILGSVLDILINVSFSLRLHDSDCG